MKEREGGMTPATKSDSRRLSTRDLLDGILARTSLLARKEIELATTEIKADFRSEITMAMWLGIARVIVILALNLLWVAAVLAVAPYMTPWLAALLLGCGLLLIAGIAGYVGWMRHVWTPLALTRKTLREDLQWAKEQLA
jgi:uncharacterized membrane protein YqjE